MTPIAETTLADLTTLQVGGRPRKFVRADTEAELVDAVRAADAAGEELLVVGGGSNLVVGDDDFPGTVVQVATTGIKVGSEDNCGGAFVTVQAGHSWDGFVAFAVERGFSGVEALSGIPGSTGATPVQNVGAYGQDVSQTIALVRVWDRGQGKVRTLTHGDLKFRYRHSFLKDSMMGPTPRYIVLTVDFQLIPGEMGQPVRYPELARSLGVEVGQRAPLAQVREHVLRLRAGKGMVLDPADRDTYSTGSFFTNPIVDAEVAGRLPEAAPRYPAGEGHVKLSAAWLISHAGFDKGHGLPGPASLSTKHSLAITNRGGAACADVLAVAREVRDGVRAKFGIELVPEPVLVGVEL